MTSSSFSKVHAMTLIILSDTVKMLSKLWAAAKAFLNAASVILSLFSVSLSLINAGEERAALITSEYSLDGICPSRYLGIVISPKPRASDKGAFPIL